MRAYSTGPQRPLERLRNLQGGESSARRLGVLAFLVLLQVPPAFSQTAPAVSAVTIASSPASGMTYGAGETISVQVGFTIAVTATGTPQLALTIGTGTGQAEYASGSGTRTLTFRYTVLATDADSDGIAIGASALTLNGGTLQSAAMTDATLALGTHALANQAGHKVNGAATAPAVGAVTIASSPASGMTYGAGETISAQVGFQIPVTVTGTPRLALTIGTSTGQAEYASGSGTRTLTFRYTVLAADADSDGIAIGAGALALNGGTIRSAAMTNASLALGTHALANQAGHKVDGTAATPTVSAVAISSSPAPDAITRQSRDTYQLGETIRVAVTFTAAVTVTGSPQLALTIGTATRQADYTGGSGTATLTFAYVVQPGERDTNGISIGAGALALNGGTISAIPGLGTHAIANAAGHKVNGNQAPVARVVSLTLASRPVSGDTYGAGERIEVAVGFGPVSLSVDAGGAPTLALTIGNATRQAAFLGGTGPKTLTFGYVVQAADVDADGLSIGANALAHNNAGFSVAFEGTVVLAHAGLTNQAAHKVNGATATAPAVTSVALSSRPASGDTYGAGETIAVEVGFQVPVTVTGTPRLALTIGSATRQAGYAGGSGTKTLTFRYTALATDADNDGIAIGASALTLNGGTIRSAAMTDAALGLGSHAITAATAHKVNGAATAPTVSSVAVSSSPVSGDTYGRGETIRVGVEFLFAVTVTGSPRLALTIGSATRQASYAGGSGTRTLTFAYVAQQADVDADGLGVGTGALTLNGGTIRSATMTDAALGLGSHAITAATGHKVNGATATPATVASVTIASSPVSGDTYGAGERIEVEVGFTIPVTLARGNPQLALTIGSGTGQAAYLSGNQARTWTFAYVVQSADVDADGLSIGAGALALNGALLITSYGGSVTLGLGTHTLANAAAHKVNGATATAPAVTSVALVGGPQSGDTYDAAWPITVDVGFQIQVEVTGSPQLALTFGSGTAQASYLSGSGTKTLRFRYRVQPTDVDADGLSIGAGALALNGGTIRSATGTNAALGLGSHALTNVSGHKVDGPGTVPDPFTALVVSSPVSGDTYGAGETITLQVAFRLPVVVTGSPQLALMIGSVTRQAGYASGSGTTRLRFSYVVQTADRDTDGLSVGAGAVSLNGGTIRSRAGTDANLSGRGTVTPVETRHKVDGSTATTPAVSAVTIASSPASGDTYGAGERIEVEVGFALEVEVTGTPQLALTIGTGTGQAAYASGSGTQALRFGYVVQAADRDADGLSVGASALALNGGTIRSRAGANAALGLGTHAVTNSTNHKVDGGTATVPAVTAVTIRSSPASGDTYDAEETIEVEVGFQIEVTVTGTPQLALTIGAGAGQAEYASGSGTRTLTFRYTVLAADADTDGVSIAAGALTLNGGTIRSAAATNAALGLGAHALANQANHKVDGVGTVPAVSAVTIASRPASRMTYGAGETIEVEVGFTIAVTVTGTPQLALTIGTGTGQADYASGSGTRTLTFRYTVLAADADSDGIAIGAGALALNGGTIGSAAMTNAALALGTHALANQAGHKVDGTTATPTVSAVAISSSPAPDPITQQSRDTYKRGETIRVAVTFTAAVTVTGSPQLALTIGTATRQADYAGGSGTATLTFAYAVQFEDADTNGISIGAGALALNGGTISAIPGLGTHAIANAAGHKVNGFQAGETRVVSLTLASRPVSGDTYGAGERIEVAVGFAPLSLSVEAGGAPTLALTIGNATRQAAFLGGNGTKTLTFAYVVQAADVDADGLSIGANALAHNNAVFRVAFTGSVTLGHAGLTNQAAHKVNGATATTPAVTSVALSSRPASGDTYGAGETIAVEVGFQVPVTVTGTPRLALTIGSATRQAGYAGGSGTKTLTFRYTALATDADNDGIAIGASALTLNGGTIRSAAPADAALGLGSHAITAATGHKVNGAATAPTVSSVAVSSSPVSGDTYGRGETIRVGVEFLFAVTVTGSPRLALTIGSATRQASYAGGSGTRTLTFAYVAQQADVDADGLGVGTGALTLNGGTIRSATMTDAALGLGSHAITAATGHKVNGATATPATVASVTIASSPVSGDTYGAGERIEVEVGFTIPVTLARGNPQLALTIGSGTGQAAYLSGNQARTWTFAYVVQSADVDADGLSIGAGALALNGALLITSYGGSVTLGLGTHTLANAAAHKVNGATATAPAVTSVALVGGPQSGDTYDAAWPITVDVGFQIQVEVTGSPQLALTFGSGTAQASYLSGSGTKTLRFRYRVQPTDVDADGLSIGAGALALNGGTIRSATGTNAALGLGSHALTNVSGHKVDGPGTVPDPFTALVVSSPVSGDTYGAGETITLQVAFRLPVVVTGSPQLALMIGSVTRQAGYASGSGTTRLRFSYVVQTADRDTDGLSVGAGAVSLNGGTIRSRAGTDANLSGRGTVTPVETRHKVDGSTATTPAVSAVTIASSPASGDTYGAGERIEVEVGFALEVEVTGTPQLALTIGTGTGQADYASGSGTQALRFGYVVQAADRDADGLSVGAGALALNGGTIRSRAGANAALGLGTHAVTNSTNHKVDGGSATVPAVSAVTLTSRPASGDTYELGETIEVEVGFQIEVTVTGTPRLALTIGTGAGQAEYASGSGTRTLTFRYTVLAADADTDGVSIAAGALTLNSGTIRSAAATNAALGLGAHALANQASHKVSGAATAPEVSSVTIASSPASGMTYGAGERIEVEVGFQLAVTVTGTPQLALTVGAGAAQAEYASGSGTRTLTFRYTVLAADADTDGVSIGASALTLNGGTIRSAAMTDATLGLGAHALANQASHKVDGGSATVPAVSSVTIASSPASGMTYGAGETISVEVGFRIPVTVTGTPRLALTLGAGAAQAAYASGSGSRTLTFRYTVQATDADTDGVSIGAGALTLNGGTIRSAVTTDAALGLGAHTLANQASHKVDGAATAPAVSSVAIASSPASGDTYGAGETISVEVGFQIAVTVTGTPQLALTIGAGAGQAAYASGSGTGTLTFRYTVQATDADTDGVSIAAGALALNGGTLRSAAMTNAALGLGAHALTNQASHKVDGAVTAPAVSAVTIASSPASGDTYGAGETISVEVGFQIAVTVTGTPQLALTIGSSTGQAEYASGSGTATLTFSYTALATDADTDGVSIGASALALNGGTLRSAAMTNAALGLGAHALANQASHKVDGAATAPAVSAVTIASSPASGMTYGAGETISVEVGFQIAVTVTGTPQLALTIGSSTGQAEYASGSGTQTLTFSYTTLATDADSDGISVGASALTLNGGTLRSAAATNATLGLGAHALANQASHKVDGAATAPAVSSVTIASSPASGDTYGAGETISVQVGFQIAVTVTGTPQLALTIGSSTGQADYASGSGTGTLTFSYTALATDADSDGIAIGASALTLNGGTIQSAAMTNATLGLGAHALANQANHKVDGAATAPAVSSVTIASSPASGDTYGAGETISVQVGFQIAVTVTGTPQLALTIGSSAGQADYASGSGTGTLTFSYTALATDADSDGVSIAASALTLNGGTIQSAAMTNATLGLGAHALANQASHKVDGAATAPAVISVTIGSSPASGDTYGAGETISVEVGFQIAVTVTGTPQLALTIGSSTGQADYASGSGTQTLTFSYTALATDADSDGIAIGASALTLNGGTIQSAATTNAALGLGAHALANQASHKVDGAATAPAVSSVTIASSPASGDTYGAGETISVEVGFQIAVTVTGTPQLALTIGSSTGQADYASGSGTQTLTFSYTALATDADSDGIAIGASALTLNGGTIQSAATTNAALGLGAHALANQASHKVDGAATAPAVSSVTIASSPASGDTYGAGETISVQVGFQIAVTVTGTPQLALTIGSSTGQADYASGSGTGTLTFSYTALATDADSDGIAIGASALTLNGGTIQSAAMTNATLGLGAHALANQASHKVDGAATAPAVSSVTIGSSPASGDTYGAGETISVQVGFQIAVTVTGTPQLALTIGSSTGQADYASGSGTQTLTFSYTALATDADSDGIAIGASALTLNGGTIQSAAMTNATLGLGAHALANQASHKVDGAATAPAVSSVTIGSSPASGDTYGAGETISVEVGFQIAVTVTGTPQLALTIGSATGQAEYASGSGTGTLTFRYTALATDADSDGVSIGASALTLNGGTLRSAATTNATLGLGAHALANQANHKVDGAATAPAVSSVTIASSPASGDTYGAGETISVEVGFQIAVTVTGTPQLALTIGSSTGQADYASGSGTGTLTFRYTALATDADSDGIAIGASALALNGGTIRSAAMTNATLGLGAHALANQASHKVDGAATVPAVSGVTIGGSPASGDTYGAGETIAVDVAFGFAVTVTGTPQLALTIGSATRQAEYASGSGTRTLTFRYTALATDADSDGISVGASALTLNGGTIRSATTTNAALGLGAHALTNQASHKVNGAATAPAVSAVAISSSPASGAAYGAGERIAVQVGFQIPVTVTGSPQVALTIGSATRQASYASGSGTRTLTFHYTVLAADADSDGISVGANALTLNGGTIRSAAMTNAALGLGTRAIANAASHQADGGAATVPAVSGVTISSRPASGDTYGAGETITVQVGFRIPVVVTGTPQLTLTIGTGTGQAGYASGSGAETLTFRYTVLAADADSDGISIGAGALALNSGTIRSAALANAALALGTHAVTNSASHKVDGSVTVPAVSGVTISSRPASGDTYAAGETIAVQVGFRIPVTVTGTPQLALTIGTGTGQAGYASGSGTATLTFHYTVLAADADSDGISIGAGALALGGGTIRSAAMTNAALALGAHAITNSANHKVNGAATTPAVSGVTISSRPAGGDTYAAGERIEVQVRFDRAVAVTGTPQLALAVGAARRQASYVSGTGTAVLVFRYVVQPSDTDADGISVPADALTLNGGTITRAGGAAAAALDLGGHALSNVGGQTVAGGDGGDDGGGGGPVAENAAPSFAGGPFAFSLAENAAGPLALGVAAADDPEGDALAYRLEAGDSRRFAVDAATGEVRYVGAGEDYEASGPGKWELTVSATDPAGAVARTAVTVTLTNEDEAPVFTAARYAWELAENVSGPLVLGRAEAVAVDAGRADVRRYRLRDADAGRFAVDAESGEVRYVGAGEDAETGPARHQFTVVVTDRDGLSASAPAEVRILDVNEPPAFAETAYAFELAENVAGPRGLGAVRASDVDAGDVLTYSLAAGDAERFAVDGASGAVRYVGGGEDYEEGPPQFALAVRATDRGGLTGEADVAVTLQDVNEAPEAVGALEALVLEAAGAAVEERLGAYFRDPDGDMLRYAAESSAPGVARASVLESDLLSIAPLAIGAAVVTVTARDPDGLEAEQQVRVAVETVRSERARALRRSLAVFGRTLGTETVEAIGGRLGVESHALGRSHVQVGGNSIGCGAVGAGAACGLATLARGASGLLGARLSIPPDALGVADGRGATVDAATLLFGDGQDGFGGGDGFGGLDGFAGGGSYAGPAAPGEDDDGGMEFSPVSGRSLLSRSSFQLALGGDAASAGDAAPSRAGWTLWGQAAAGEFEGAPGGDGFTLEGRTQSAYAGLDYRFASGLLVGLAGSHNRMESDFAGRINGAGAVDARLTGLYPYLHWSPREGLGLWGLVGGGRGSAALEELDEGGRFSAGLGMRMTAVGVRQEVVGPLALKADAFAVRITSESEAADRLAGVTADAQRLRLASELTGQWTVGGGVALRAQVELGGRFDRGDAETGMGAEAGGALGFTHLGTGLSVDARGRTLLVHQADDFREWGASFAVRLQPGREQGGLSFALEPSWGVDAGGGAQTLWRAPGGFGAQALGRDPAAAPDAPGWRPDRLALTLGWGVVLPGGGEFTPFGRWSREGAEGYRLNAGTRWAVLNPPGGDGRDRGLFLARDRGLRLLIDLFAEQLVTRRQPMQRRVVLQGRFGL